MAKSETNTGEIEDEWTETAETELVCMCCSERVEPRLVGASPNGRGNPVAILRCPECLAAGDASEFDFPGNPDSERKEDRDR